ncbi:hypothetical protein RUM43_001342 [Polyplax serrata]|uniref:Uncharacterized protein n=1 Tax=Polyplax serrata TaxID=468196 RepID=A0AAN8SG43_POLSC
MEIDESLFNGNQNLERYADQPIVPHMVKPIAIYDDDDDDEEDLMKMAEDRRESSFSIQSDVSIATTGSNTNLPHMKYFRTPSVVVSDHSEDTGCVTYDDIKRIHTAYHRRRRTRPGRRHSDVFLDMSDKNEFGKRSDSTVSGSTHSDATEYFRGSQNISPVPRRKGSGYRDGQKSLSFDSDLGDFDLSGGLERKTLSECSSSNELSPIVSRYCSSNYSETSSRSSICSEISPVLVRKTLHFNELQGRPNFCPGSKSEKNSPAFCPSYLQSRDSNTLDDTDFFLLERQRSLSYDDLYQDASIVSDMSCSDLSIDFSACSSLSNLPGTVYCNTYNPNQDNHYSYLHPPLKLGVQYHRKSHRSQGTNIKTSKSCSDFLSVSRISEDYPNSRHRRHSNDHISCDVGQYSSKKSGCREAMQRRWVSNVQKEFTERKAQGRSEWSRLLKLQLKSFHESLNFLKENCLTPQRKSKSFESVFNREENKSKFGGSDDSVTNTCFRLLPKRNHVEHLKVASCDFEENKVVKVVNASKKVPVKKEWLSVEWGNGDADGVGDCGRRNSVTRKISDCSTCSTYSGDHDTSGSLNVVNAKTKVR